MTSQNTAIIDLSALRHNLGIAKKAAPNSKVMAVIKADAYGHGMVPLANALSGVDAFAVARVDEAIELRQANIKAPIVVLAGYADDAELSLCSDLDLDVIIHGEHQIDLLKYAGLQKPLTVWVKLNTGMNRLGFDRGAVSDVFNRLSLNKSIRQPIKLMTHLACADNVDSEVTEQQITLFDELVMGLTGEQSIANSAGLLAWAYAQRHWVRPGIMLYGASPFSDKQAVDDGLKPVMTLSSKVLAIRTVKKGQRVGYGGSWQAPKTSLIATIGIGYGDGYPRHAKVSTPVLIKGQKVSLVGRVSMDSITVDISGHQRIKVGDDVVLWGVGLPIEDVADACETISYDLMCGVTDRVPRQYMEIHKGG